LQKNNIRLIALQSTVSGLIFGGARHTPTIEGKNIHGGTPFGVERCSKAPKIESCLPAAMSGKLTPWTTKNVANDLEMDFLGRKPYPTTSVA
jgi:hypothetical protein